MGERNNDMPAPCRLGVSLLIAILVAREDIGRRRGGGGDGYRQGVFENVGEAG